MSGTINFEGVNEAQDKNLTAPGTIGVFDITKVEFGESPTKKTPFMGVSFEDQSSTFKHNFYLSAGALPRIQTLALAVLGEKLGGSLNHDQIIAKFTNKKVALKVKGREGDNGKVYPDLEFGGFAKPVDKVSEFSFTAAEQKEIDRLLAIRASSSSENADSEGSSGTDRSGVVNDEDF